MKIRSIAALAAAVFALTAPLPAAAETTVSIANYAFAPARLTVKAGTRVVFVNDDDSPHSVVDRGAGFHSQALDTGERFAFTFDTPGEFVYFCGLHPQMTGAIEVTPRGGDGD